MTKNKIKEEPITTMGIVVPVEWDTDGQPMAYAFSTYEEKEYLIDIRTPVGKELTGIEKQKIRVTGTLGPAIKNRRVILVSSYERVYS